MTTKLLDANGQAPTFYRGTSPSLTFAVTVAGTSTPKDLTGASEASFAIAPYRAAASRDLLLTLGDGVTHNDTGGVVTVALTAEQTEALPVGRRWLELWITDSQGRRDMVGAGDCFIYDTLITVS